MNRKTCDRWLELYRESVAIYESGLTWEEKYDLIFDGQGAEMQEIYRFSWSDPDLDYEDGRGKRAS